MRTRTAVDIIVPWMGDLGHNDEAEWIFHMRMGWGGSDFGKKTTPLLPWTHSGVQCGREIRRGGGTSSGTRPRRVVSPRFLFPRSAGVVDGRLARGHQAAASNRIVMGDIGESGGGQPRAQFAHAVAPALCGVGQGD